jgi:hypothetical protein
MMQGQKKLNTQLGTTFSKHPHRGEEKSPSVGIPAISKLFMGVSRLRLPPEATPGVANIPRKKSMFINRQRSHNAGLSRARNENLQSNMRGIFQQDVEIYQ